MLRSIISRSRAQPSLTTSQEPLPPFSILPRRGHSAQNIASLFGHSDPNQRAGILNTLLASGGAGVLSRLGLGSSTSKVTPEQAQNIPPQAVELAAEHAQTQDPSVVERASEFYSHHPQLVQALGVGAALLALQHLSRA